jgi:hypothetical protein
MDAALRVLGQLSLGQAVDEDDVSALQAAADPQDRNLPADQLARQIILRESAR